MADFRLRVTAETQDAERKLRAVDKTAAEATKNRNIKVDVSSFQDINKRFKDINASVKEAGNNIQTFYRFSKNIPGIGERVREVEGLAKGTANLARSAPESAAALRENAKAGAILSNSFEAAGGAAGRLINNLAKAGFALFAVKEAVGLVQAAFGGFFNETIGREIKLRETILKTQTTLASTNKVFRNGTEITDPYQKIVALTGEVAKRIDSIRERSIALAGVTSNEVIEVFGIVASQIGQIGGGLKDAEDLATSASPCTRRAKRSARSSGVTSPPTPTWPKRWVSPTRTSPTPRPRPAVLSNSSRSASPPQWPASGSPLKASPVSSPTSATLAN